MEASPNELKPPRPGRHGMSKRPMYIVLGVTLALIAALFYAIDKADQRTARRATAEKKPQIDERTLVPGSQQGQGIILPPPPTTGALVEGVGEEPKKPLVVVMREEAPDQEAEARRKHKEQQLLAALSSPMVTKRGAAAAAGASGTQGSAPDAAAMPAQPSENYDPAADIDKEGFFTRADTTHEKGWLSRYTREEGRLLEIKTGTVIPAVMVSGINSDLPGVMIAQVSQNVWNTATGKHLMIPQGSKLYGVYDSRVVYGQERVLIAWNRILFPDGSSVTLGSMPGADMSGYAGFKDKVNHHYFRIFGSAFFMSAILGTTAYTLDELDSDDYRDRDNPSFQDEMITALAQQMGTAAMQLLQRNLNIKPTLEIRPGYQFNVIATKDVVFSEPYTPHNYEG
ncbi:MAG: TrbI/VirB10 family protein [Desulfobulbus sp.]|jgi:type IV secretory pathway VirB10-like protein